MKRSKFTETQIFGILKESEAGIAIQELCRKHGISQATFYKWRASFGGMNVSMMKRLRELEQENQRLKRMYANAKMEHEIIKEALEKKF
jgi:putative transposase